MNPETLLVNTVLPVLLISTLLAALLAYWFALAVLGLNQSPASGLERTNRKMKDMAPGR